MSMCFLSYSVQRDNSLTRQLKELLVDEEPYSSITEGNWKDMVNSQGHGIQGKQLYLLVASMEPAIEGRIN